MRLRPRTWFLLSLLLFAAAALFWHLGERKRAADRAKSAPSSVRTIPFALTNTTVYSPVSADAKPGVDLPEKEGSIATSIARTNPFAYRLSNTKKSVGQLIRDERGLLLENALLDTANARPEIPAALRAQGDPGSYIVQARGPITDGFRQRLSQCGAQLVSYIPNNAMLVRATPAQAACFEGANEIAAVLPFEPYYKLDPSLLALAVEGRPSPFRQLNVVVFPNETPAAVAKIKAEGGEVIGEPERTPFGDNLVVKMPARKNDVLARIPEVQLVGIHAEKRLLNDLSRVKVNVSTNTILAPPASHYLGLLGSNVLVAITDSGVDATHEDFGLNRIWNMTVDVENGHGTHVAGTLLGNGSQSGTVGTFPDGSNSLAQGSIKGAIFSGMAPYATGYVHYYALGTDIHLQEEAALSGAKINNNSWGYTRNTYDIFAASYDAAVRDSLSGVPGEQQMTYVFAAGNDGGPSGNILSPATAKNVISVGASKLFRHITNLVWKCDTNGVCQTNAPWFGNTSDDTHVASFSSRGNVGIGQEGPHGRFKPDVIAPGAMVVSCRMSNYLDPVGTLSVFEDRYNFETWDGNVTNLYSATIPRDCLRVDIFVVTNTATLPDTGTLWIAAAMDTDPAGQAPLGSNSVTLTRTTSPSIAQPGTLYFTVANFDTNVLNYDVIVDITVTNDLGNYWEKLKELNDQIAPKYRYESGTSMSAPIVSGMLAQMEEYYRNVFSVTNSPALNKALLINGARSLSVQYNLDPHATANNQGWGLVNISNSAPAGLLAGSTNLPLYFFDQSTNNALATGDSQVYTVTVPSSARSAPLRITLAWTDPAGNPISGPKLVNDLDLFVDGPVISIEGTNASVRTNRWIGNNFIPGSDFTASTLVTDTNGLSITNLSDIIEATRDEVNNVENVYIPPPLGGSYTVTVKAHRVNVNAVNTHTNGIVQDYALVLSCGTVVTTNTPLSVAGPVTLHDGTPFFTAMQRDGLTNAIALINQHVGANSPFLATTNGTTNQWAFYVFTNLTSFTNVAILTFMPPNLGFLHPDPDLSPKTPRFREGDIDLYVARSGGQGNAGAVGNYWNLTNLDTAVISASERSTGRSGTEYVIFSNAAPNEVYYIGVKAEDQQAATFGIFAVATQNPFSHRDESNNIVADALFLPIPIPDGTPDEPGGTNIFAFVLDPDVSIQRIYVTNTITHEDPGDLIGILHHTDSALGQDAFATLNNHRYWLDPTDPVLVRPYTFIYDDSGQDDLTDAGGAPISIPSDGPGTLNDFVGQQAQGLWTFTISDNALFHTGTVDRLTLVIEPSSTNQSLPIDITRTVLPFHWLRAAFDVNSTDITNAHACVAFNNGLGPVDLFLRRSQFPTLTRYDKAKLDIFNPGDCLDLGVDDNPALTLGRYFVGLYNNSGAAVTIRLTVRLDRGLFDQPLSPETSLPPGLAILDDAVTNSVINVSTQGLVSRVEVDVRLDHPRASELALYVVNPEGTRVLLAENRGGTNGLGYGLATTNFATTNLGARVFDSGFEEGPERLVPIGGFVAGWTNELSPVLLVEDNGTVAHTNVAAGVNALDVSSASAILSTNVVLVPGRSYILSVGHAAIPGSVPSFGSATISVSNAVSLVLSNPVAAPGSWGALQWSNASAVFRATARTNRLEIRTVNSCGYLLDSIRIDEGDVRTNSTLYASFTDDPTKLPVPIKFAPPPFGDTNFNGTNVFISGFEWGTNGIFTNGQQFDGWLVTSNSVFVQSNSALSYSDTNYLLLRTGTVSRLLPTIPGKEYLLQFASRSSGRVIYNTGVDRDGAPLGFGTIDSHYFTNASPAVPATNAVVLSTNVLLPLGWFAPSARDSRWIGVDANSGAVPSGTVTYRTQFDLRGYDTNTVQLHVAFAAGDSVLAIALNGVVVGPPGGGPNGFTRINLSNFDGSGFRQRTNTLEFVVQNTAPSVSGFRCEAFVTGDLLPRALPRLFIASGEIRLIGGYTNTFVAGSDEWRLQTVTFVAWTNQTTLEFEGLTSGAWVDHVQMRETGRKYYLPEEPLTPLLGQQAFGPWQLQVWDTRLGGIATNVLLSWRLNLSYARTNPPFQVLTDRIPKQGGAPFGGMAYFAVEATNCDAIVVNNTISGASALFDVWFNQDMFPTGSQQGDVLLASGVGAVSFSLTNGFYPMARAGRYYLGVSNTSPVALTFNIEADMDCSTLNSVQPGMTIATASFGPNGMTLSWSSAPGSEFYVMYASDPNGPWTAFPNKLTSASGQFSFSDDGSLTGGLPARRFYRLQQLK